MNIMSMSKEEAARHLREGLGKASDVSQNRSMLDAISRAVLRNPSPESRAVIKDLKDAIKLFVSQHDDDALLQTLINAASEGCGVRTPAALREWCNTQDNDPSIDITVAISLLSAFSYTSIYGPGPETPTIAAVRPIMAGAPPYIGKAFDTRAHDMASRVERGKMELTEDALAQHNAGLRFAPNRTLSGASGLEGREGYASTPPKMPKRQTFIRDSEFAIACEAAGVPIVGHVSGTTPSNLGAANGLLRALQISRDQLGIGLDDDAAQRLAGLTAARFHRFGFHSAPEVLVGMRHWESYKHRGVDGAFDPAHPQQSIDMYRDGKNVRELFVDSVKLMAAASTPLVRQCVGVLEDVLRDAPTLSEMGTLPQVVEEFEPAEEIKELDEDGLAALYDEIDAIEAEREGVMVDPTPSEGATLSTADNTKRFREAMAQGRAQEKASPLEATVEEDKDVSSRMSPK